MIERSEYSIHKEGRDCFLYRAGGRQMRIVGELGSHPDYVIYAPDELHWLPPFEVEPVSPEEQRLIFSRLGEWLRRRGMTHRVER